MDKQEKDVRYRKAYERNEAKNRCGYWDVCDDHACGCSPTAKVSQGYDYDTYDSLNKSLHEN